MVDNHVRFATTEDLDNLVSLGHDFLVESGWEQNPDNDLLSKTFSTWIEDGVCLVVRSESIKNDVIGFLVFGLVQIPGSSKKVMAETYFYIAKEHRKKGAGRSLVNALESYATLIGCSDVVLELSSGLQAIDFSGYTTIGTMVRKNIGGGI